MFTEKIQINQVQINRAEQDLNDMERAIGVLKREFEMYFSGGIKLPPLDSQDKLAKRLKNYGTIGALTSAQRFRYNSLSARYSCYADLWGKQLRNREEGRTPSGSTLTLLQRNKKPQAVSTHAQAEDERLARLYRDYLKSRNETGEPVDSLNYQRFCEVLLKQRESILNKYRCQNVEFYVAIEQNRTKLKARVIK